MQDNGILEYYRSGRFASDGIVDLSKVNMLDFENSGWNTHKGYFKPNVTCVKKYGGKKFFVKTSRYYKETESEVLLSQIYHKAGVKSAIYTPVVYNMDRFLRGEEPLGVISNNVKVGKNFVSLPDVMLRNLDDQDGFVMVSTNQGLSRPNLQQNFTDDAVRKIATMLCLDLGAYNTDRSTENYFLKQDLNGKATDVVAIDNGISYDIMSRYGIADAYLGRRHFPQGLKPYFMGNYFGQKPEAATREQIVQKLKTNEVLNEYISPHTLAETIGSLNIPEIARDIKQTIGFDVGSDVANAYDKSFYTLAEELEQ